MSELKRLVIDLRSGELVLRVLYHSRGDANRGTVRRRREVVDLCRGGLQDALEYAALRLRLENAHAATEAALVASRELGEPLEDLSEH
jgi:hypothetical protein